MQNTSNHQQHTGCWGDEVHIRLYTEQGAIPDQKFSSLANEIRSRVELPIVDNNNNNTTI